MFRMVDAAKDLALGISPWTPGRGNCGLDSLTTKELTRALGGDVPGARIETLDIEIASRGTTDRARLRLGFVSATFSGLTRRPFHVRHRAKVADAMIAEVKVLGLEATVGDVRAFFVDEHVHLAVIVNDGRVVTTIERKEISGELDAFTLARSLGTLEGRCVRPNEDLVRVHRQMVDREVRRLVVLGDEHHVVGLLCLKRHGRGFCRDEDVHARLDDR